MTTNYSQLDRSTNDIAADAPRAPTFRELMQRNSRPRRKEVGACGAVAEPLEQRRHFAVTSSMLGTVMTITGDNQNNTIEVIETNHAVSVYADLNATPIRTIADTGVTSINITGGDGNDVIFIASAFASNLSTGVGTTGTNPVNVTANIDAGRDADYVYGTDNADSVVGGFGADHIFTYGGADTVKGEVTSTTTTTSAADTVDGDQIEPGDGNNVVYGQYGNDTITCGNGADQAYGDFVSTSDSIATDGDDVIDAGAGANYVQGDANGIVLGDAYGGYGHSGADNITTGNNDDTVYGDAPTNSGPGNDTIFLNAGSNLCYGGYGDDSIVGGANNDTLYGGAGNDSITLSDGVDVAFGDDGDDWFFSVADSPLHAGDSVDGGLGTDCVSGGTDGNDVFTNM